MEADLTKDKRSVGKTPLRCCLVSGRRADRGSLIRFVVSPDGIVTPDLKAVLPGRGMWLSADRETIKTACARNLFNRAARRRVIVPEGLVEQVERLLVRRCVDRICRAAGAGLAVAGFEKVRAMMAKELDAVGVLVVARDGAGGTIQRVNRMARNRPIVDLLSAAEMGEAFNRERVVQAVLAPGGLADGLWADAQRLAGFRTGGQRKPVHK